MPEPNTPPPARPRAVWPAMGVACLTMLGTLLLAEGAARLWLTRVPTPSAYDDARNPHYRRDWVAFTQPPPREDPAVRRVVLIGNSQAFGTEIADASRLYAARLEAALSTPDAPVEVLNFSSGGIGGPEMLLLAARAADHDPDLVVVVTHSRPFSRARTQNTLAFDNSDIARLAYLPHVRARLHERFLDTHSANDPVDFLSAHLGLLRVHDRHAEQRFDRWVAVHQPRLGKPRPHRYAAPPLTEYSHWLFRQVVRTCRLHAPDAPVLLVAMPVADRYTRPGAMRAFRRFADAMQTVGHNDPLVHALDATDTLGSPFFYTASHLKPGGHGRLAQRLAPHITTLLANPRADLGTLDADTSSPPPSRKGAGGRVPAETNAQPRPLSRNAGEVPSAARRRGPAANPPATPNPAPWPPRP